MKLVRFYSEGELSSIRVSNEEETVIEVKNLFFDEQLTEEQIMLEIYSQNRGNVSDVDELRLDFDRIFTRKQLVRKAFFKGCKFVDSSNHNEDFSMNTIIGIKEEQKYLSANFRSFMILHPRSKFFGGSNEPMLFATLRNNNFYLVNLEQATAKPSKFNTISNWIKRKISSKTSLKS